MNEVEITKTLKDSLDEQALEDAESVLQIIYQPQAVFKVSPYCSIHFVWDAWIIVFNYSIPLYRPKVTLYNPCRWVHAIH